MSHSPAPSRSSEPSWKTRRTLIERLASDCEPSWEEFHWLYRSFVGSIAAKFGIPSGETDGDPFDRLWNDQWHRKVIEVAMQRVVEKPRNLLIFQALAIQEMPVTEVCQRFGISRSNADTIKNRVKNKLGPVIRELEAGDI